MTIHIGEMTTSVDATAIPVPAPAAQTRSDSSAELERARRAAERAARIAKRTHGEGYDD